MSHLCDIISEREDLPIDEPGFDEVIRWVRLVAVEGKAQDYPLDMSHKGKRLRGWLRSHGFDLALEVMRRNGVGISSMAVRIGHSRSWVARRLNLSETEVDRC